MNTELAISNNEISERIQKASPFMLLTKNEDILPSWKHQVVIIRAFQPM